jgi:hypothetical protein
MSKYIQIMHGKVVNVWDSPPKVAIGEDGWVEAIENIPTPLPRQQLGNWTYDISVNPAIISRELIETSFEQRKATLLEVNKQEFLIFVERVSRNQFLYSQEEINSNKQISKENELQINLCVSHDDLDSLVLSEIKYF